MAWDHWYREYDHSPSLQARLAIVRRQIAAALDLCPPGPIRIISLCAGDGRDLVGALLLDRRRLDAMAEAARAVGRPEAADRIPTLELEAASQ